MLSSRSEYQDICWLASGQHGHVYKCIHLPTGRLYARKAITPISPDARSQLVRELAVLMRAECPNLLQLERVCEDHEDHSYGGGDERGMSLILEYCPHGSLADYLATHWPVDEPTLAFIAKETLNALLFIQSRFGLHHRDLKPANLLIDRQGRIKLADFGECGGSLSGGALAEFGTVGYKAPECLQAACAGLYEGDQHGKVDQEKADVWSLGIVLTEAAAGSFPFHHLSLIELYETVVVSVGEGVLRLPTTFSNSARHFVEECCLRREPTGRAGLQCLLEHPFLDKAAGKVSLFS
jgi:mitogen-activated protein kinase kinase 4/5